MKFYLTIAALLAFLAMECIGLYWLTTGSLPPPLLRVEPTVLVAGTVGVIIAFLWALVSMFNVNQT